MYTLHTLLGDLKNNHIAYAYLLAVVNAFREHNILLEDSNTKTIVHSVPKCICVDISTKIHIGLKTTIFPISLTNTYPTISNSEDYYTPVVDIELEKEYLNGRECFVVTTNPSITYYFSLSALLCIDMATIVVLSPRMDIVYKYYISHLSTIQAQGIERVTKMVLSTSTGTQKDIELMWGEYLPSLYATANSVDTTSWEVEAYKTLYPSEVREIICVLRHYHHKTALAIARDRVAYMCKIGRYDKYTSVKYIT